MGLHESTIEEIRERLGFSERRVELIGGLERYLGEWSQYGLLEYVVVDGSFATDKPEPDDVDLLLVPLPASLYRLEMLEAIQRLAAEKDFIKHTFGCHAFVVQSVGSPSYAKWVDFFSHNKEGIERGLLAISMAT